MGFKKNFNSLVCLIIIIIAIFFLTSCSDKEKEKITNTFYVELMNFKEDSIRQNVSRNIFGKVSFYRNSKLEILSMNYVTDEFPEMHYFRNIEELKKEINEGVRKIRVEYAAGSTLDSIRFSLQKFIYHNKQWVKTSDMGFIKITSTYKEMSNIINDYGTQVVNNIVLYSYN